MKKEIVIGIVVFVVIAFGVVFTLRDTAEKEPEEKELGVEEVLREMEGIFEIGEEIVVLEEAEMIDADFTERYIRIEDRFFEIRDAYFAQNVSEEKLREEIEKLLKEVEYLESELKELIKVD